MKDNVLGEYQCEDCGSNFKINGTPKSAYDGWMPCCPVCGLEGAVEQTSAPKTV